MHHFPMGTVTFLFTDIEGSTQWLQHLGERYPSVLEEYRSLVHTAFHAWSGHEVDTQGDGFFVAFARASEAIGAAVEMQRSLASHATFRDCRFAAVTTGRRIPSSRRMMPSTTSISTSVKPR